MQAPPQYNDNADYNASELENGYFVATLRHAAKSLSGSFNVVAHGGEDFRLYASQYLV